METICFFHDLSLKRRSVEYPGGIETKYMESYDRGRLVARIHYARFDRKTGTTPIIRRERFPTPMK